MKSYRLLAFVAVLIAMIAVFAFTSRPAGDPHARPPAAQTEQVGAVRDGQQSEQPGSNPPHIKDIVRILVPDLEIDAPIVTLGVDADGTMQAPGNPLDVAWYSFSARPGEAGNVVMSGHLDYVDYGPAVFYRLKEAQAGDEVLLVLADASLARYRVQAVTTYDEATAPVQDIVGRTHVEVLTLITCGGSFDPRSGEYDKRVVLRAERIEDAAPTR